MRQRRDAQHRIQRQWGYGGIDHAAAAAATQAGFVDQIEYFASNAVRVAGRRLRAVEGPVAACRAAAR